MAIEYHEDGFYYNHTGVLDKASREVNAGYITSFFRAKGWTDNAIAAMLGNFYVESNINPARWEDDIDYESKGLKNKGFGLAQWTPWAKYTEWCDDKGLIRWHLGTACLRVWTEFENVAELKANSKVYGSGQYYSTTEFDISRSEFIHSTESPEYLAKVFVRNYERPGSVIYDPDEETKEEHEAAKAKTYANRAKLAAEWYEFITGQEFPSVSDEQGTLNKSYINKAVQWAVSIANDDTHGYDQENRWGEDYDCSSLIIQAYENAGCLVKTEGATSTANMCQIFVECGFTQLDFTDDMTLYAGDVLWREGHCAMYIGDGNIVSAHINELGTTTGGQTGDQTEHEIDVSDLAFSGEWVYVLRLPTIVSPGVIVPPSNKRLSKLLLYAVGSDIV